VKVVRGGSMVGRICGKGEYWVWSGREWEWWTVRVVMMGQMSLHASTYSRLVLTCITFRPMLLFCMKSTPVSLKLAYFRLFWSLRTSVYFINSFILIYKFNDVVTSCAVGLDSVYDGAQNVHRSFIFIDAARFSCWCCCRLGWHGDRHVTRTSSRSYDVVEHGR